MQWEDPPEPRKPSWDRRRTGRTSRAHDAIAAELRANPGRWGVVTEWVPPAAEAQKANAYALATQIRTGRIEAYRPVGSFEAVGRVTDDYGVKVYARYIPEDNENGESE